MKRKKKKVIKRVGGWQEEKEGGQKDNKIEILNFVPLRFGWGWKKSWGIFEIYTTVKAPCV